MLEEMPSYLLTEWMAYYKLEPFGAELLDSHLAEFRAMMASKPDSLQDPQKFKKWKKVSQVSAERWNPFDYFNELKQSFGFGKKKD